MGWPHVQNICSACNVWHSFYLLFTLCTAGSLSWTRHLQIKGMWGWPRPQPAASWAAYRRGTVLTCGVKAKQMDACDKYIQPCHSTNSVHSLSLLKCMFLNQHWCTPFSFPSLSTLCLMLQSFWGFHLTETLLVAVVLSCTGSLARQKEWAYPKGWRTSLLLLFQPFGINERSCCCCLDEIQTILLRPHGIGKETSRSRRCSLPAPSRQREISSLRSKWDWQGRLRQFRGSESGGGIVSSTEETWTRMVKQVSHLLLCFLTGINGEIYLFQRPAWARPLCFGSVTL